MLGTENGTNNTTTYDIYVIGEQIRFVHFYVHIKIFIIVIIRFLGVPK